MTDMTELWMGGCDINGGEVQQHPWTKGGVSMDKWWGFYPLNRRGQTNQSNSRCKPIIPHKGTPRNLELIPDKNLLCRLLKLAHHRRSPPLRPRPDAASERLRTNHNALNIPRPLQINRYDLPALVQPRSEIKGPQELGDADEETAFGEMDAGTETATGAEAVVVAAGVVGCVCVVCG